MFSRVTSRLEYSLHPVCLKELEAPFPPFSTGFFSRCFPPRAENFHTSPTSAINCINEWSWFPCCWWFATMFRSPSGQSKCRVSWSAVRGNYQCWPGSVLNRRTEQREPLNRTTSSSSPWNLCLVFSRNDVVITTKWDWPYHSLMPLPGLNSNTISLDLKFYLVLGKCIHSYTSAVDISPALWNAWHWA